MRSCARWLERTHDFLAVILAKGAVAEAGAALIEELRALPQPLPVIYLGNDGLPKIAESSGDLAWFQLELPVKQRRLSAVLDQAHNVRSGHPTQPGAHRFRPSGASRPMREVHRLIEQVAPFGTNVLILGESGTGKGNGGPPHSRALRPRGASLRAGQLRRDSRRSPRERAVRT